MRKTATSGLIVGAMMALGLGFASPAVAAIPVITPNPADGTVDISGIFNDGNGNAGLVRVCPATADQATCAGSVVWDVNVLYLIDYRTGNGVYGVGSEVAYKGSSDVPLPAGTYQMLPIEEISGQSDNIGTLVRVVIGGGSSSGAAALQPQTLTLSINTDDDSSCKQSSVSGLAGTWIDLPGADDCTAPASKPEADLLGWATTPNFPIETAQRQIDNGWGVYEIFDDDGRLTAVFIPVGGASFLSGDGNLFAVWSE